MVRVTNFIAVRCFLKGVLLATLLVFSACATRTSKTQSTYACEFEYDENIKTEVVMPLLRSRAEKTYQYFNFENPSLMRGEKGNVEIRLFVTKTDSEGYIIRNENTLVIVIDPCRMKVAESYWQGVPMPVNRE